MKKKSLLFVASAVFVLGSCGPTDTSSTGSPAESTPPSSLTDSDESTSSSSSSSSSSEEKQITVEITSTVTTVEAGKTITLTAAVTNGDEDDKVTWTSGDTSVATIDANGVLTGVKAGKATITAAVGEAKDTVEITVTEAPKPVSVEITGVPTGTIYTGQTIALSAKIENGGTLTPAWSIAKDPTTMDATIDAATGSLYTGTIAGEITVKVAVGEASDTVLLTIADLKGAMETAVNGAVEKAGNVASGTVTKVENYSGYPGEPEVTAYEYGADSVKLTGTDYFGDEVITYVVGGDGAYVGVEYGADGTLNKSYETYEAPGYAFSGVTYDYELYFYGAEDLLEGTFAMAKTNANKDAKFGITDDGYSYSFGVASEWVMRVVEVEFALTDDGELASLELISKNYSGGTFTVDPEYGTATVNPGAEASSETIYEVSQTIGARTLTVPFDYEGLFASSFKFSDEEGNIYEDGDEIEIQTGSTILTLVEIAPSTASFDFDVVDVTSDNDAVYAYFTNYSRAININASETGEATLTITSANCTYTLHLTITPAMPKQISITQYTPTIEGKYNSTVLGGTSVNGYVGSPLYFKPAISPYVASQDYAITVDAEAGQYEQEVIDLQLEWSVSKDTTKLLFKEAGSYQVTFASAVAPDVKTVVTFNIVEAPSIASVLDGEYAYKNGAGANYRYAIEFTPNGTDGLAGEATLTDIGAAASEEATYVAAKQDDGSYKLEFTHVSGATLNWEVWVSPNYEIIYKYNEYNLYTMSKITPEFLLSGTWYSATAGGTEITVQFLSGNFSLMVMKYDAESYWSAQLEASYSIADTAGDKGYEVTITPNGMTPPLEEVTIIDFADKIYLAADFSSITITLTIDGVTADYVIEA